MEPFRNALPLGDAEFARLEELLASEIFQGEAMRLDELQGLLCAVVSAPVPVAPSAWMPAALGDEPTYESDAQAQEIMDLLLRLYNEVAAALHRGEEPELILYPDDEGSDESDFGAWADGYLYGTHLGNVDWLDAAGEYAEDLSDLLESFFLLNGAIEDDVIKRGGAWMSAAAERKAMRQAAEDLPVRVLAIYDFWKTMRFPAGTSRREFRKVGRNEPCPCGSGKKYKQCCGYPKNLH